MCINFISFSDDWGVPNLQLCCDFCIHLQVRFDDTTWLIVSVWFAVFSILMVFKGLSWFFLVFWAEFHMHVLLWFTFSTPLQSMLCSSNRNSTAACFDALQCSDKVIMTLNCYFLYWINIIICNKEKMGFCLDLFQIFWLRLAFRSLATGSFP